ncbi:argininosuccinate synthase [Odoribacter laneus]|jgi:argininosuccinate synthase|uniref:argininosuccinate synthase n=1 Tax=Odoribacter laneus YIT 12061 TaxID=742817 RepID=H1DIP7_9BACT|nr:argininosuccinate synthase domain-containing protein [Odoribacter laneus]EHP46659.1 argininosuccinate synthase [Odoribacter laneus YIT 12061]MBS1445097.1 argininosuccinate synthase [Odoribacter sp.]GKI21034.1 argininosuccinate synthase [Odoribacter laneus]GKI25616.1 argininosuccinate synthase [Odoribacter laneus]
MEKVVLAYSGGLDTSYCVKYLSEELGLEVYTALANTGGFSTEELKVVEEKAYALGAKKHVNLDVTTDYYEKCIKYMVFGNVLRNHTYPISVSSERTFQALAIVNYANEIGAQYIAHGSTGAGNDQIRFDLCFNVFAPDKKIITPTRDLKLSREEEIAYLKAHGVSYDWKKMEYSINKGVWGTSIGGKETLQANTNLPEEAYPSPLQKAGKEMLEIEFEQGEVVAVNGQQGKRIEAIRAIEAIASPWAIGRDTHVGDTIVGIKGRVGFEAAAPLLIIKAHELLEKHTLTKWQQYWKEQLGNWYGMFLHEAMYSEPVMRDIERFLENSQRNVSGKVKIQLRPYHFDLIGIESVHDLMNSGFAEYGEMNNAWTSDDVKGFTKMIAMPLKIYNAVNHDL